MKSKRQNKAPKLDLQDTNVYKYKCFNLKHIFVYILFEIKKESFIFVFFCKFKVLNFFYKNLLLTVKKTHLKGYTWKNSIKKNFCTFFKLRICSSFVHVFSICYKNTKKVIISYQCLLSSIIVSFTH